ncbi:aKG-HExxH-type peptide beta-hydroxylase [Bacillus pacificus]|uniref:aKG-HExxH-type peptide beta-hydroxylase n=1 Tax=Bacillus pacificus TaxID=2026187 RepID=UPI003D649F0C
MVNNVKSKIDLLRVEIDDAINKYQQENINKIESVMLPLVSDWHDLNIDYTNNIYSSLLFQTIHILEELISEKKYDLADKYLNFWKDYKNGILAINYNDHLNALILDKNSTKKINNNKFLDDAYLFVPDLIAKENSSKQINFSEVKKYFDISKLSYYTENNLSILVILDKKEVTASTRSYTITSFPGTVFSDWTEDEFRLAEAILHESTHNWLNTALSCYNERIIYSENFYYSPWKDEMRPAFGILHATAAFTILLQYFKNIYESPYSSERAKQYAKAKIGLERKRLTDAKDAINACLELIENNTLKSLLKLELDRALS